MASSLLPNDCSGSEVSPAATKAMDSKQRVLMNQAHEEIAMLETPAFGVLSRTGLRGHRRLMQEHQHLVARKDGVRGLGCSSGTNVVARVSIAIETTRNHCLQSQSNLQKPVLLNDLPDIDFNMVVKRLVALQQINDEPVCVTGIVPGSFYERLFPSGSVHLVCSSNSLHWLSKLRFLGVMASEGLIDKAKLYCFYVPAYRPSDEELRKVIQEEGSFSVTEMRVHDPAGGIDSTLLIPNRIANTLRAAFEPIIVQHFGEVVDEFVRAAEKHLSLQRSLQVQHTKDPRVKLVVSLKKA